MIYNILLLLAANVFIPLIPIPPQLFVSYWQYQYNSKELTIYDDMNLTRHYNEDQFKKSFRDSLKRLHPDRGGSQENFARIKAAKEIMQQPINYYDLYNITVVDLKSHSNIVQAASMKELLYEFQTVIFYFIALLYFIAFTIDDKLRPSRKLLIPLTLVFCAYEFYIHFNPKAVTVIDMIDSKIPLFMQSILIKRIFCILTAIIRTRSIRKKNQEDILLQDIQRLPIIQQYQSNKSQVAPSDVHQQQKKNLYIQKLNRLSEIYVQKLKKMQQNQRSLGTRIKNWISKGFSFLIIGLMIWGIISSTSSSTDNTQMQTQF